MLRAYFSPIVSRKGEAHSLDMARRFLPEERLDILRKMDRERKWYSLDDKRVCSVCDRVFTGRQVEIESAPGGRYLLHCPTPCCPFGMAHWFLCELSPARFKPVMRLRAMPGEVAFFNPGFSHG